jgi:hypothetical protein
LSYGGALNTPDESPTFIWQAAELRSGEDGVITITGIIDPAVTGTFSLTNQAEIRSRTIDANLFDNIDVVTHEVNVPLANSMSFQGRPNTQSAFLDSAHRVQWNNHSMYY